MESCTYLIHRELESILIIIIIVVIMESHLIADNKTSQATRQSVYYWQDLKEKKTIYAFQRS